MHNVSKSWVFFNFLSEDKVYATGAGSFDREKPPWKCDKQKMREEEVAEGAEPAEKKENSSLKSSFEVGISPIHF